MVHQASCKFQVIEVVSERHVHVVRELFEEYIAALGIDLTFQNVAEELVRIRDMYMPPGGALLLAEYGERPAGCVGLRKIDVGRCEMKRLYVRKKFRSQGVGNALCHKIIAKGKALGYREMLLDTLASMKHARALYQAFGFQNARPYYHNPLPGARYMSLVLRESDHDETTESGAAFCGAE